MTSVHSTISPSQVNISSVTSERQNALDILTETINGFNELTILSTINNSEEDNTEIDPNRDPKVASYNKNEYSPHKSILNWFIPKIIPGAIRPIDQTITEDLVVIGDILDARQTVLLEDIVTNAARSGARIFNNQQFRGR